MKLHDLKPQDKSKKSRKRVGRGTGSGSGKTSGRGMKGQGARTGGGTRLYHSGGNLPMFRKLPFLRGKGFTPINRIEYNEVNLDQLKSFPANSDINPDTLAEANLLDDVRKPVVILGRGKVDQSLKVSVHRISENARSKIEAAGGSVEIVED